MYLLQHYLLFAFSVFSCTITVYNISSSLQLQSINEILAQMEAAAERPFIITRGDFAPVEDELRSHPREALDLVKTFKRFLNSPGTDVRQLQACYTRTQAFLENERNGNRLPLIRKYLTQPGSDMRDYVKKRGQHFINERNLTHCLTKVSKRMYKLDGILIGLQKNSAILPLP